MSLTIRKVLGYILGGLALILLICAVWLHQDWGWLKFLMTSLVVAFTAILLVAPDSSDKRP